MDQKRLYKARGHRMVCGVCGCIAEYFGVDPTEKVHSHGYPR